MSSKTPHSRPYSFCQICQKEVYNFKSHLKKVHPNINSVGDYYKLYIDSTAGKCLCGKDTTFENIVHGFRKYCSEKCATNDPGIISKRMKSMEKTLLEKYEVTNPSQVPGSREKAQKTYHKTVKEKYNVDYTSQTIEVRNKFKDIHANRTPEEKARIHEKGLLTLSKKWNMTIKNFGQCPDKILKGDKEYYTRIIEYLQEKNEYGLLLSEQEFCDLRTQQRKELGRINQLLEVYPLKCLKHGTLTNVCISQFVNMLGTTNHLCPKCQSGNISRAEKEVLEFVQSVYTGEVLSNTKKIISPLELDIYIPELKLGIEYHGLYWHSFNDENYHLNKYLLAKERGIKLIQIFEDEWKFKPEIIKSMIINSMGITPTKLFARKLKVVEDLKVKEFTDTNHISGHTNYLKSFSLVNDENETVSTLTLRKPFTKGKSRVIEIARFCSKLNTSVVGGFSKLLKYALEWSKKEGFKSLLTYADLRFGEGLVYSTNGFEFIGSTKPNYFYTGGTIREGRFKYRAQDGLSEKELTEKCGVRKIYDCGSNRYEMRISITI